jgi:hypothetical protein
MCGFAQCRVWLAPREPLAVVVPACTAQRVGMDTGGEDRPPLGTLVSPTVVYELEGRETLLGRNDSCDIVRGWVTAAQPALPLTQAALTVTPSSTHVCELRAWDGDAPMVCARAAARCLQIRSPSLAPTPASCSTPPTTQ